MGQPIPLELHHKDGNKNHNELSNYELLCPNCHAFTDSYRGKNCRKDKSVETIYQPPKSEIRYGEDIVRTTTSIDGYGNIE